MPVRKAFALQVWGMKRWGMRDGMAPGEEGDSWVVTLDVSTPSTPSHCRANPTIIIPSNKSSRISQLCQNHQLGIEDSGLEIKCLNV